MCAAPPAVSVLKKLLGKLAMLESGQGSQRLGGGSRGSTGQGDGGGATVYECDSGVCPGSVSDWETCPSPPRCSSCSTEKASGTF